MTPFYITETTTKDGLIHKGLFYKPTNAGKCAVLWVHGLTDNFYSNVTIFSQLAQAGREIGLGIASFNNRGHDVVSSGKKLDPTHPKGRIHVTQGSGYEIFTECVHDIDAGVSFLVSEGFSEIIIAGISTGANKVCYYAGTINDPRVAGVVLASPISDVPFENKGENFKKNLSMAKELMEQGRGEALLVGVTDLTLTARRYVSLYEAGGLEDVFDYYAKEPKMTAFSNILKPLLVLLSSQDEYADRPITTILEAYKKYQKSSKFSGVIIDGAFHSFSGKEKEVVSVMIDWIKSYNTR